MKIAVVGSRDASLYMLGIVRDYIKSLPRDAIVISGGARGVDKVAEATAESLGIKTLIFEADWDGQGKGAGFIRNREIIAEAEYVVAFWDGKSKGTKHTIDCALEAEHIKRVTVYKSNKFP